MVDGRWSMEPPHPHQLLAEHSIAVRTTLLPEIPIAVRGDGLACRGPVSGNRN